MILVVSDVRWGTMRFFMKVSDSFLVSCVMLVLGTYVSNQSMFDMFNEKTFIFMKRHNVINKFRSGRVCWPWYDKRVCTVLSPYLWILLLRWYTDILSSSLKGKVGKSSFLFLLYNTNFFSSFHGFVLEQNKKEQHKRTMITSFLCE